MTVSTAYISASANRFSHVGDVAQDSTVAFGSANVITLWDITTSNDLGIYKTLSAHEATVTCVQFRSSVELISADEKGVLLLWVKVDGEWKITSRVTAHNKPITSLRTLNNFLVSGSSDSTVKVWEIVSTEEIVSLELSQTIALKYRYPLDLALNILPGSQVILLAISGTDTKVHLYLRVEEQFIHSASLAGHEDWVRTLSFRAPTMQGEPLILASGSQDATIRLWNIEPLQSSNGVPTNGTQNLSDELLDVFETSLGEVGEGEEGGRQISLKRHILTVRSVDGSTQQFSVTFDALLIGHEAGITSLSWRPDLGSGSVPTILSSSTDSSLILWSPSAVLTSTQDGSSSIWINRQRFGDIGGQRLGGFVGSIWAKGGQEAIAWGWAGGLRRWSCTNMDKTGVEEEWQELGAVSGHKGPVKGLSWSPSGEYLISAGVDQTTRIHGQIFSSDSTKRTWHEVARPQVHGYDLLDALFLEPLKFVSIADEKVARVFEAPSNFVRLVEGLDIAHLSKSETVRPVAASVPPLGLSNKAMGEGSAVAPILAPTTRRPFEGELASATLWPEVEKIFGHGYESITLSVSHSRKLIATACRATTAEHAIVRIYETKTFKPIGNPLSGHSLTVTRVAFSPDDKYILTVSRDRMWHLYEAKGDQGFVAIQANKTHARIIWDCAWSAEGDVFVTASRDKTVLIWAWVKTENKWSVIAKIKTPSSANAIDISPINGENQRRLAIGLEDGNILIYNNCPKEQIIWTHATTVGSGLAHANQINRLSWRPTKDNNGAKELASCSEDGSLKVLIIQG